MGYPTLSLMKADYEEEVGIFLGYGRGDQYADAPSTAVAWTAQQAERIDRFVRSGLRKFYFPALPGGVTYEWSFLRPTATLTLASGASTILFPDDYGGIEGDLVVTGSDNQHQPVRVMGVGQVQQMLAANSSVTGPPSMCAIRPLKGTGDKNRGQRSELVVYPKADEEYSLQARYYVSPNALTGDRPHVYGGPEHHETILEACLAAAEQRGDDAIGTHSMLFQERLAASIRMDRRHKPQHLGQNLDRSDDVYRSRRRTNLGGLVATIDGVEPD